MNNQLTNTGIKTAGIFRMERARGFNPVKGCSNRGCHLHPSNKTRHPIYPGDCWAAQMCNRMAGPWAESEAKYLTTRELGDYDSLSLPERNEWRGRKKTHEDLIKGKLKEFIPTWFESQYQKQFPEKRSCILIGYMTDIAFIPKEWVQKIIDKIMANNEEREKYGLQLHIFQFLTKDPTVYQKFKLPKNCQLGFTATNQAEFDTRYRIITDPFGDHWNSNLKYAYLEPLREKIKLSSDEIELKWVIVGGGPTPLHPDWARGIRDQCLEAGIPFYFKGWNKWLPIKVGWGKSHLTLKKPGNYKCENLYGDAFFKVGSKKSGNILDGKTWEQFPEVNDGKI